MSESLQSGAGSARATPSWLNYCLLLSEVGATWKGVECLGGLQMKAGRPLHSLELHQQTVSCLRSAHTLSRDLYFIAEQPAPAPHLAHPEGCAALRLVLVTLPREQTVFCLSSARDSRIQGSGCRDSSFRM